MPQLQAQNREADRRQSQELARPINRSGEEVAVGRPNGREDRGVYRIDGRGKLQKSPVGQHPQSWSEAQSESLLYADGGKLFDSQGIEVRFGRPVSVQDADFGERDFISPRAEHFGGAVILTRLPRPGVIRRAPEGPVPEDAVRLSYTEKATGEEVTFRRSGALVTFKFKLAGDGTLLFANPGREDWTAAQKTNVVFRDGGKLVTAEGKEVESIGVPVEPDNLNFRGRSFIALDGATYKGMPVVIAERSALDQERAARPVIAAPRAEEVRLHLGGARTEARSVRLSGQGRLEMAYPGSDNFSRTDRAALLFYENGSVVTRDGQRVDIGNGIKDEDFAGRDFISPILDTSPAIVITRLPRPGMEGGISNRPPLRINAGEALLFDRATGEEFRINYGNGGDVNKFKVSPQGELLTAGAGKEIWSPARRTALLFLQDGKLVDADGNQTLPNLDVRAEDFSSNSLIHLVGKTHNGKPVLVTNLPPPAREEEQAEEPVQEAGQLGNDPQPPSAPELDNSLPAPRKTPQPPTP